MVCVIYIVTGNATIYSLETYRLFPSNSAVSFFRINCRNFCDNKMFKSFTFCKTCALLFSTLTMDAKSPTLHSNSKKRFHNPTVSSFLSWPDVRTLSNRTLVLLSSVGWRWPCQMLLLLLLLICSCPVNMFLEISWLQCHIFYYLLQYIWSTYDIIWMGKCGS